MTYEEALKSEKRAREEVLNLFPDVWKKELFRFIHHSEFFGAKTVVCRANKTDDKWHIDILSMNDMVDHMFDKIKAAPIRDELVTYNGKEYRVTEVVNQASSTSANGVTTGGGNSTATEPLVKLSSHRGALDIFSDDTSAEALTVPLSKVRRDRQMITKNALRKFLKEVAGRVSYLTGPWIVKVLFFLMHDFK